MELFQEIRGETWIAIEFRITAINTGDIPELPASGGAINVEGTAFLALSGDKITKVWTVFDTLALALLTVAIEALAWWPGAQLVPERRTGRLGPISEMRRPGRDAGREQRAEMDSSISRAPVPGLEVLRDYLLRAFCGLSTPSGHKAMLFSALHCSGLSGH
ncbi:MAG: hypothetical protein WAK82_30425 [Streptosporangiaceae bacterium]